MRSSLSVRLTLLPRRAFQAIGSPQTQAAEHNPADQPEQVKREPQQQRMDPIPQWDGETRAEEGNEAQEQRSRAGPLGNL